VDAPVFYYDLSSPYAYLAALRVDDVLPVRPEWRPIAFGVIIRAVGKVPWSMRDGREARFDEIAARARDRGLPEFRYPEGWPAETYSLVGLRALLLTTDQDQQRAAARELYRTMFVDGRHLADVDTVRDAVARAGIDVEDFDGRVSGDEVKQRLRAETDEALEAGVTGIPTVAVDGKLFWGDDRLEEAAAALHGAS
jgi:2-hydroxychromene-2-carboxylate isomerase